MDYNWTIKKISAKHNKKSSAYSQIIVDILASRGFSSPEQIQRFLFPALSNITEPFALKDMQTAATRVADAIMNKEKILIFGDYDADGVTATAILHDFFTATGVTAAWYIPHRIHEGYNLKPFHVDKVIVPEKATLVITVDCGSDSVAAATRLSENNIDLIITDHHTVSEPMPKAIAFVNPARPDCTAGLGHLAGVGVAFYLLMAVRKTLRDRGFFAEKKEPNLKTYCDRVAIGTVGDIVPLISENRIFTKTGLEIMGSHPVPGITALADVAKVNKQDFNSDDIAFRLSPRINAAGRMSHAATAVNLLVETKKQTCKAYAAELNTLNTARQSAEATVFSEIIDYINETPDLLNKRTFIFARQGWNPGITGIIASRIARQYYRPVILIALDGTTGKGSGRSIPGVNLYHALAHCTQHLTTFGGHAMAAGLAIKASDIKAFSEHFEVFVRENTDDDDFKKTLTIESRIHFSDINDKLLDELELFQPFGTANTEPLFIADDVAVLSSSPVGKNHKRLILSQKHDGAGNKLAGIHFNVDDTMPYPTAFKHLVFKLRWNRWNNAKSPQLIIEDYMAV